MTIFFWLTEIAASFVEQFVLYRVMVLVFQKQEKKMLPSIFAAGCGAVLIVICNQITLFSYFTMAVFLGCIFVGSLLIYREKLIVVFSVCCFYMLCMSCLDFLAATLISNLRNSAYLFSLILTPGMPRVLFIVIIKAIWIGAYLLLKRLLGRVDLHKENVSAMLVVSIGGYVGFVYLSRQTFQALEYDISELWFIMVSILLLLLFVFYFRVEIRNKKQELDFEIMRNALLEDKYREVSGIYNENAKLYHDLNNHLNITYQLIQEGDTEEAKKYIEKISRPMQNLSKTVWTGVDIVDVILNSKIDRMKQKGISYSVNAEFPQNTNISSNDICTILSNLLDNAIEAAEKVKGAQEPVMITMRRIRHFLLLRISNPCIDIPDRKSALYETTKEDKKNHGWGLPSTVSAVEKYGGTIDFECKNGIFSVTVLLFYREAEK